MANSSFTATRDKLQQAYTAAEPPPLNLPFALILEHLPHAVRCFDRSWRITYGNAEAKRVGRYSKDEAANPQIYWERHPDLIGTELERRFRRTMEEGIPDHFEFFYEAFNVWVDIHTLPTDDGMTLYYRNITDRKQAEVTRDEAARQLQQTFEATNDAVISVSRDWKFTFLNRRALAVLSIKGDLIGKNIWTAFPAMKENPDYTRFYERAMHERIAGEFEAYYPDSVNIWANIRVRPSEDGIVIFFRDITSERVAHQTLLDQQATLAFVQQTSRVATWELALPTGAMSYTPGSFPVFGRPFAELPTLHHFQAIIPPEHWERILTAVYTNLEAGAVRCVDFQVIAPDHSLLWVEGKFTLVLDENGVTTHLRGMSTDITGRRRKIEELAASEERYRVLADLNPQAIWMGSPDGAITYANQGFLDYIGLTMEAAGDGLAWLSAFYEEDRAAVLESWTRSISLSVEYDIEARMIRAQDQAIRWWWLRALPIHDDTGQIVNWLGIAIDVHDRKIQSDELLVKQLETERQRAEIEAVYATAPIGLALFDPIEFRYLRANDRQAAFFGMTPDALIGRSLTELAPFPELHQMFEHVARGNSIINHILEGELPTDPGNLRSWTVNYLPVYNADGTIQAISAAFLEITTQKKAEAALIQSEKLAAVGRLASSISHEINNPLEAITNILYLIDLNRSLPDDLKPLVNMAQSELARVCQIATQTLRFHRQAFRAAHVTAEHLVGAVLNLYQGRLANSNIRVEAIYTSNTPILCFENDIRQVLNNLIANAIDAMRQNGGRLIVRAHDSIVYPDQHPEGMRGVRITIADTGHGMTPEVRARIFEPFYTTKDLNGTGLGLWISAGIVARHKGHLTLRSATDPVHHGTIFSLLLPVDDSPSPTPKPSE